MKTKLEEKTVRTISDKVFPGKKLASIEEINSGFCNTIYILTFEDSFKAVVKIAPKDTSGYMTNEVDLMKSEVQALKLTADHISVKTPTVYAYDDSLTICDTKYLVMEYLTGVTYESLEKELTKEEKEKVDYKIGKLVKEIAEITSDKFGFLGDEEHQFDTLCEFVEYLLNNVISDAVSKNIDFFVSKDELLELFEKDRRCFEYMEQPCLVHYDLWQGNIFLENKEVTGIIDWERALFGEPLMEDRFRLQKYSLAFFEGFRQSQFNYRETRRLLWYDIILYLTMMCEGSFRGYEDDGIYNFAAPLFKQALSMLQITF